MPDRRYNDKEIAAIFRAATDGPAEPHPEVPRDEGLTLADLQAIGGEVGIAPEAIVRAAQGLDVRRGASRTFLGLPLGVARTVNLNRRLTDAEWERLVVQLREVFDARGVTRSEGSLRQWTNGNLQVLLEPTDMDIGCASGQRTGSAGILGHRVCRAGRRRCGRDRNRDQRRDGRFAFRHPPPRRDGRRHDCQRRAAVAPLGSAPRAPDGCARSAGGQFTN
jgi:hypothetical protein